MNTPSAKFILQARRPDGSDDQTPHFTEALAQARLDPQLGHWLEREQTFDAALSAKLRSIAPPAGLREAILAGARLSQPVVWWRQPRQLALAASLAVLLSLAGTWQTYRTATSPAPDAHRLTLAALEELRDPGHHSPIMGGTGALQKVLSSSNPRLANGLPMDFAQLRADGCRTISLAGLEALEICFDQNGIYHLYVVRRADTGGEPVVSPVFREQGTLASVTWQDARHTYILLGEDGSERLRALL